MDDRPPPMITITDPTRPSEPVDVMVSGDERDPWRPQRKHWVALGVLVLLGVAWVVPDRVISARADDRRAERAAVAGVRMTLSVGGEGADDGVVPAVLTNDGAAPLELVDVQVDGYEPVPLEGAIGVSQGRPVDLADSATCGEQLLVPGTENRARVRVRTAGGTVVTRRVVVPSEVWLRLNSLAQTRCGLLPVSQSLAVEASGVARGSAFDIRVTLRNGSRLPAEVSYVEGGPGLAVDLGQPGYVRVDPGAQATMSLRVTVQSCLDARNNADLRLLLNVNAASVLSDGSMSATETLPLLGDAEQGFLRWFDQRCPQ